MSSRHIVVLDRGTLMPLPWQFDFEHTLTEYDSSTDAQALERCRDAHIVITNKVKVSRETIAAATDLEMVAIAATGYEHVDIQAASERGITVSNIRAYGNDTVAEHAFMLMMALMRQLPAYQRDVGAGLWNNSPYFCHFGAPIHDVNGKTLLIFGKGGIGSALAQRAEAFGMKVIYGEHKHASVCREGYVPFQDALKQADVISLHCPLNEQTYHLLGEEELKQLKMGCVVINVGRGGLVDEQALIAALKYGGLGGAGFDVITNEPPVNGNPLVNTRLPNLIVTPHMAWGSQEAMTRLFDMLIANINAHANGQPQNQVLPKA